MMNFQSLMVSSSKRFKQHHHAVFAELDGEVALFQSNTCDYLVLNETGSAIWNALKSQPTLSELCKHLEQEYEVTPDECKSSIETWLEAALEKKVIAVVDD
ncbi:PqqD family protein [Prochlorococcus marinus]|uniref:PqqD family protein n=1 Tax=Prochlorococcus marinus TaxID=1219 RepID=UPI0007BC108A|nr:PqqD family protein [Prochlorococcus marinus]KZR73619.1 Coenzyme PQQ synthesis protein D (PqqD) [Prochlorococcus marinus str. MIT 1320]